MRADNISRVLPKSDAKYGATMGRENVGTQPPLNVKVYDKRVPMCTCCGGYDKEGNYWGTGKQLRVKFTSKLDFIQFYRIS